MRDLEMAEMMRADLVDTHVHVFRKDAPMAAGRRYQPVLDALPGHLLAEMTEAGIGRAVLVQPSFLGTDNGFLLRAIAEAPHRFAGIAVVPPEMPVADLADLRAAGVRGVRLNCIGADLPDFQGAHGVLAETLAALDMLLQIQAEGGQWAAMADRLAELPCAVVIDHFGRTPQGDASHGFESLLRAASRSPRLLFKLSAPYRMLRAAAGGCAAALLDAVGPARLLWGSDWPHTQHEGGQTYAETLAWLEQWVPAATDRARVLSANPARLFFA
jgi:predicted TIM-barrel fold metal-dependent hydrolase